MQLKVVKFGGSSLADAAQFKKVYDITPMQYSSFIVLKLITVYLNHAIALSRMESHVDANRYLCMAEKLVNEHPEVAASEAGIVQRITIFRKNGMPKPKREEDSEQESRK